MEKKYVFEVDPDIKIVIERKGIDIDAGYFYYYGRSVWLSDQEYHLNMRGFGGLKGAVKWYKERMEQALDGNLMLHESLRAKDLGFLAWQQMYECTQEKPFLSESPVMYNDEGEWVGSKYLMWDGQYIITWLYNDVDGSIVFAGAPAWHNVFCKNFFDEPGFFEWMKNYKSFFRRILSKETLHAWIKTSEELLHDHELVEQAEAFLL